MSNLICLFVLMSVTPMKINCVPVLMSVPMANTLWWQLFVHFDVDVGDADIEYIIWQRQSLTGDRDTNNKWWSSKEFLWGNHWQASQQLFKVTRNSGTKPRGTQETSWKSFLWLDIRYTYDEYTVDGEYTKMMTKTVHRIHISCPRWKFNGGMESGCGDNTYLLSQSEVWRRDGIWVRWQYIWRIELSTFLLSRALHLGGLRARPYFNFCVYVIFTPYFWCLWR